MVSGVLSNVLDAAPILAESGFHVGTCYPCYAGSTNRVAAGPTIQSPNCRENVQLNPRTEAIRRQHLSQLNRPMLPALEK